jgi:PEP-CTERM motif
MNRKFVMISLAAGLLPLLSLSAGATVVTFESGVGGCSSMTSGDTFLNQCAADNVTGSTNDYFYVDARDTFDGQGISNTVIPGQLFFTVPVSNLSMDYVLINGVTATFEIFDTSHTSLGTFSDDAIGGDKNASYSWGGIGIAELDFSGYAGVVGVSTLTFNTAVPEPSTLVLVGACLLGLGAMRRRRKANS